MNIYKSLYNVFKSNINFKYSDDVLENIGREEEEAKINLSTCRSQRNLVKPNYFVFVSI